MKTAKERLRILKSLGTYIEKLDDDDMDPAMVGVSLDGCYSEDELLNIVAAINPDLVHCASCDGSKCDNGGDE